MNQTVPRVQRAPGVHVLNTYGVTLGELAESLEPRVTRRAAGHYLAGRRRPPAGFRDALAGLVGSDGAREILLLIPTNLEEN